jgi:hypothetical protein
MLKKVIAGAIAAGALSVPLAGVAWADKPSDPGSNGNGGGNANGVGSGGIPGRLGSLDGAPESHYTPGELLADLRETAAAEDFNNLPAYLREETDFESPGAIVSDAAQGELSAEQLQELLAGPEE